MILADTSVWIHHFRLSDPRLKALLARERVALHPFVLGELACGNLRNRAATIAELELLPEAPPAPESEVLRLLESHRLWGRGIGWIDMHLLTTAVIEGYQILTVDRALGGAAKWVGVAYPAGASLVI